MSSPPLVLITGGNGFVGYAVLAGTLMAGVSVFPFALLLLIPCCLTCQDLPDQ